MRDASKLNSLDGFNYIASVPKEEIITAMVVCENQLYVSTDKHVYKLIADKRLEIFK